MRKIKRAIVSVSDKTGLIDFVQVLRKFNVEIIATGGTAKLLKSVNIKVTDLSKVTNFPEILEGRVKTLHPAIHGGILARHDKSSHLKQLKQHKIKPVDMLVVNLYPFASVVNKKTVKLDDAIENIDIGGVALLRAGAKNFQHVAVVSDPSQYIDILEEMKKSKGIICEKTRKKLACGAFHTTAVYDSQINKFLCKKFKCAEDITQKQNFVMSYQKVRDLRYGENPHQKGGYFADFSIKDKGLHNARVLWGKPLSFNNIMDIDSAYRVVSEFKKPGACFVKHTNPCGVATAKDLLTATRHAHECDALSAFGGIVGLNRKVDEKTAKYIQGAGFLECVIAPDYTNKALEILKKRKNLRILSVPTPTARSAVAGYRTPCGGGSEYDIKKVTGGILVQESDSSIADFKLQISNFKTVTKKKPTKAQTQALKFAWKVVKHVKSNAIVYAKDTKTVGIGAGQMSRVDSVKIAGIKAGKKTKGAVMASDAFFPKTDNIYEAKKAGISAIIQPGGSIKDDEVIKACDKLGIAMVFTGKRHFKH